MTARTLPRTGAFLAAMLLVGCMGGAGVSNSADSMSVGSWVTANFIPPSQLRPTKRSAEDLFVADVDTNVLVYTANINQSDPPLLDKITQGVSRSTGVYVDRHGTLYVLNFGGGAINVTEYKRGNSAPFKTITDGLDDPNCLVVDHSGNLYVDQRSSTGRVLVAVYAKGASSPKRTIQIGGSSGGAGGMAFDSKGNLLVDVFDAQTNAASVYSVAPGSSKAVNLNLDDAFGAALGADRTGYIYVGDHDGTITIYASGNPSSVRAINLNAEGFYTQMAVTPSGTIYWPNYDEGSMYEIASGGSGAINVFSTAGSGIAAAVGAW